MSGQALHFVVLGLSITSSWGNGHATTYRALLRELAARGHKVTFLECDRPWYAENRDCPSPTFCGTFLYSSLDELRDRFKSEIANADVVIVGSYVPDGVAVGAWVLEIAKGATAFYDIDTPVTIEKLSRLDYEYIAPWLIPFYDIYLSFSGGPNLLGLQHQYRAALAKPLYCSVDPALYSPDSRSLEYALGYLGTYSEDRHVAVETLMLEPARRWSEGRFILAGPQYPGSFHWPSNVDYKEHLDPSHHRAFYTSQRFSLNVTRRQMVRFGYSPSVRLFEAAACGTPIITDVWTGIDSFFVPGEEILLASSPEDTLEYLRDFDEEQRQALGQRARTRVLAEHTAAHRAEQLELYMSSVLEGKASRAH